MTPVSLPFPRDWTLEDLVQHLGVPACRILLSPMPGTAVETDVLRVHEEQGKLCELVEGVLVEKTMGMPESKLGLWIAFHLQLYLRDNDLGELGGADGPTRLDEGLVRIPDVSYFSHQRIQTCATANDQIPALVPDLAIEIISPKNTRAEIARKLKEYCFAGTTLVWVVDPKKQSVRVYTAPDELVTLDETGTLSGEPVLPGFRLSVSQLFSKTPRVASKPARRKKSQ